MSGEDCPTEAAAEAVAIVAEEPEATLPCASCTHYGDSAKGQWFKLLGVQTKNGVGTCVNYHGRTDSTVCVANLLTGSGVQWCGKLSSAQQAILDNSITTNSGDTALAGVIPQGIC